MLRALTCAATLTLAAAAATAGPWARGAGATFLSFGYEASTDIAALLEPEGPGLEVAHLATAYLERGVSARLTFGFDAALDPAGGGVAGYAFLRRTLTPADAVHQFAVTGGLGLRADGATAGALAVLGASWGRGLDTRWGGGWAEIDTQVRALPAGGAAGKLDATLGLRPWGEATALIGQVQVARYPGADVSVRLSSSVARRLSERLTLEAGVLQMVGGDRETGLKLATWIEF